MAITLEQIVARTRERVAQARQSADREALAAQAQRHGVRGFRRALERRQSSGPAIIAELKQASPSRGTLRGSFHVASLALQFEGAGAAALSVLTEEELFSGSLANLVEASAACALPCLRKDFLVDELQLVEARANRADAVLLIAAALSETELKDLAQKSRQLGLGVLCEIHDEGELGRALDAGCDLIGVNSRDLRTLEVDLGTALRLGPKIPDGVLRVAESGIRTADDLRRLSAAGFHAFLIGESLMQSEMPGEALARLLADYTGDAPPKG